MKSGKVARNLVILMIVLSNIGCDQITKTIVRHRISYNESIEYLGDHFTLTKVENSGAFLSLGNSLPVALRFILFSLVPLIALTAGIYFLLTRFNTPKALVAGLCFIIGGGTGNLYDRIRYGSVTDFMHIDFVVFQTGIFNMADVSVMLGVLIILIHQYLRRKNLNSAQ